MKVGKYRKKPVEVSAAWFECPDDGSLIAEWCGGTNENSPEAIDIPTLEGTMRANLGDWAIRGVQGEFYPCKPDIFAATYEAVDVTISLAAARAEDNPGRTVFIEGQRLHRGGIVPQGKTFEVGE